MIIRRPVAVAMVLLVMVSLISACGGGSGVSSSAGMPMQLRVAAIRDSLARGDRSTAESQLSELRADVLRFRADDKVDDAAAQRILRAADVVQARLSLLDPPPTTTTSTSTTSTTTKPPKEKGHDKENGKGKGDEGD